MKTRLAAVLASAFLAAVPALADAPRAGSQSTPTPEAELPFEKGMKSRVFDVKHRDPATVRTALRALGSGARGSTMEVSHELRTLAVRDFPENIATIAEALERLDKPTAAQPDVELRIHVLSASRAAAAGEELPGALKDAVATLRSTLAYKGYRLLSTFTQRVTDGARGVRGGGVAALDSEREGKQPPPLQMEFSIASVGVTGSSPATVRLNGFKFQFFGEGRGEMATEVTLKEGEQVVVGTSVFKDRGIVLVVSATLHP